MRITVNLSYLHYSKGHDDPVTVSSEYITGSVIDAVEFLAECKHRMILTSSSISVRSDNGALIEEKSIKPV